MPGLTRYNAHGQELKPGLRQPHQSNFTTLKFDYVVILDSEAPDVWHGEALFAGQVVVRTGGFPNETTAGIAAENALKERLLSLLTRDPV